MKRSILFVLAALAFAACGNSPGNSNKPGNTTGNSNPNKTASAPTREALVALENKAFEAWKNKDGKFFEGFIADKFAGVGAKGEPITKAAVVKDITESKCEVTSFSFSDEQMTPVDADNAVLTVKATADYKCDGKPGPPVVWSASVYTRSGDGWQVVYHNEAPVADPKAAPPSPPPPAKSEKPSAEEKPADTANAGYLEVVKKGWETWKNRDAKGFEPIIAKDFVLIDPAGQRYDRGGAIKSWTETKCDIKGFTLTEQRSLSLSSTVGLLMLKGTADGSCEGVGPLGALWGTYLLVKEGDAWKVAMIFESPA